MKKSMTIQSDTTTQNRPQQASLTLDVIERLIVLIAFGQMVYRLVRQAVNDHSISAILLLPSEALVVALILFRRRAQETSQRPLDWFCTLIATLLPTLLVGKGGQMSSFVLYPALFLMIFGLTIQIHAKLTLGRGFGVVPANRGVRVRGPYAIIRHPMYCGYLFGEISFLMGNPTIWNISILATSWIFQIYRIHAEERLLGNDPAYREYSTEVQWRLIPGIY